MSISLCRRSGVSWSAARGREEDPGHTYDFWYRGAAEKHVSPSEPRTDAGPVYDRCRIDMELVSCIDFRASVISTRSRGHSLSFAPTASNPPPCHIPAKFGWIDKCFGEKRSTRSLVVGMSHIAFAIKRTKLIRSHKGRWEILRVIANYSSDAPESREMNQWFSGWLWFWKRPLNPFLRDKIINLVRAP